MDEFLTSWGIVAIVLAVTLFLLMIVGLLTYFIPELVVGLLLFAGVSAGITWFIHKRWPGLLD